MKLGHKLLIKCCRNLRIHKEAHGHLVLQSLDPMTSRLYVKTQLFTQNILFTVLDY